MHLDNYTSKDLFAKYFEMVEQPYIQHQVFIRLTVLYEQDALTDEEAERYLIIALTHSYNPNTTRLI